MAGPAGPVLVPMTGDIINSVTTILFACDMEEAVQHPSWNGERDTIPAGQLNQSTKCGDFMQRWYECLWRVFWVGGKQIHHHSRLRFSGHVIGYWLTFANTHTIWCLNAEWRRPKINCNGYSFRSSGPTCWPFHPVCKWQETQRTWHSLCIYASELLSLGLLYLCSRMLWQKRMGIDFLEFGSTFCFSSKQKNYAIEALTLLAQYHMLLPQRLAEQLKWSRFTVCLATSLFATFIWNIWTG